MNQEKIGKFISDCRKEKNLTQQDIATKLGVSVNAVSKWERGICLMDMSLLKPLSQLLGVNVIDVLSGEKVKNDDIQDKFEESIENIVKLNEVRSKSFGIYGLLFMFIVLVIYKAFKDICIFDIVSLICCFNAFKFIYKYKLEKNKGDLIISLISLITCLFLLYEYIIITI